MDSSPDGLLMKPVAISKTATTPLPHLDPKAVEQVQAFMAQRNINRLPRDFRPENSRFFVIKSNSSFNIQASIIHGVWSSTELGNRRLDAAFKTLSNVPGTVSTKSTGAVYLFFSVTSSGRFCGMARMASALDWNRSEDIWEMSKRYKGTFELEWVFLRDIPNSAVRHLRVSSNENKPVSNSRDTQELTEQIGLDMVRIFSESETAHSVLYDMFAELQANPSAAGAGQI